jgi:methyltransferase (TIGR00027 family)
MRDAPSRTAEAVALFRALEQLTPEGQRVLDDPYARLFLSPIGRAALTTVGATGRLAQSPLAYAPVLVNFVLARHRFIDDALAAELEGGEVEQVLLLGAGYDTRAWRFADALDGVRVFEVDHPSTARRKASIVEKSDLPEVARTVVHVDFQVQSLRERLLDAGFEPGRRTFTVWEGVSMYLTRDAVKACLRTLKEITASNSKVTADFWFLTDGADLSSAAHRMSTNLLEVLGEPVLFGIHPEEAEFFVGQLGYDTRDLCAPAELEARYLGARRSYPAVFVSLLEAR